MARDTPALSAYDHFAAMVFSQLTYRESLRDIEACLGSRRRLSQALLGRAQVFEKLARDAGGYDGCRRVGLVNPGGAAARRLPVR